MRDGGHYVGNVKQITVRMMLRGILKYLVIGQVGDFILVPAPPRDESHHLALVPDDDYSALVQVKVKEVAGGISRPRLLGETSLLVVQAGEVGQLVQQTIQFHSVLVGNHVEIVAPNAMTFQLLPSLTATVAAPEFPSVTQISFPAVDADGAPATL